jgi:hypothetical protein
MFSIFYFIIIVWRINILKTLRKDSLKNHEHSLSNELNWNVISISENKKYWSLWCRVIGLQKLSEINQCKKLRNSYFFNSLKSQKFFKNDAWISFLDKNIRKREKNCWKIPFTSDFQSFAEKRHKFERISMEMQLILTEFFNYFYIIIDFEINISWIVDLYGWKRWDHKHFIS